MLSRPVAFEIEQRALHLEAARVAGERAVRADHPVARHYHRHGVAPVRAADRAGRARTADPARDLGIRGGLAVRDRPHLVPHAALERRALELDGELELGAFAGEVL